MELKNDMNKVNNEHLSGVKCRCHQCIEDFDLKGPDGVFPLNVTEFIVCPKCGNKRCPKASNHRFKCAKSNEVGQKGSIYT